MKPQDKYFYTKHYLVNIRQKVVSPMPFDSGYEAREYSKTRGLFQQGYNLVMKGSDVIRLLGSGKIKEVPEPQTGGHNGEKVPAIIGLLTEGLRKKLPPLYSQEKVQDPTVWVKFFTPWSNWTWYATEFDGDDLFFGWVVGFEKELGYFSLSEMQSVTGPMGLKIERDIHFEPQLLSQVMAKHGESLPMVMPQVEGGRKEYTPKPAWQMTRQEYYEVFTLPKGWKAKGYTATIKKSSGRFSREYTVKMTTPDGETLYPADRSGITWTRAKYIDDHRMKVETALEQGLPVPREVLADYPLLKRR